MRIGLGSSLVRHPAWTPFAAATNPPAGCLRRRRIYVIRDGGDNRLKTEPAESGPAG